MYSLVREGLERGRDEYVTESLSRRNKIVISSSKISISVTIALILHCFIRVAVPGHRKCFKVFCYFISSLVI